MESALTRVQDCISKLQSGTLQEDDLTGIADELRKPKKQSLLYIQTSNTDPTSRIVGMSIFEDGQDPEAIGPDGGFLYASIGGALADGWRIVKFPELALALHEQADYTLGSEFVLERWR